MKGMARMFLAAGLAGTGGYSYAITGYVDDSQGSVVRTGDGDCVHTERWSVANAVAECEPEIVAARDGVDVAAVQVVVRTERRPVRLESDTLFAFDSADLTERGRQSLDAMLAEITAADLQEHKIQVSGYTDRLGPEEYNLELSRRRAAVVHDYLVSKGVVPRFIEMQGFGEANPLVACTGERGAELVECLAPNRRTEVEFSAVEQIEIEETVAPQGGK
ncbi:MAG: OmpA family protein [Gammaproteobacteria bacterium]|jgi:OOP family OmpA-OmpF porin